MEIKCRTGFNIELEKLRFIKYNPKKHSLLLLEQLETSLKKEGLLYPITVQKDGDDYWVIDGSARVKCLLNLKKQGELITEVPVVYVTGELKKNLIISCSTNHFMNKTNLSDFSKDTDLNLKDYSFYDGELMDFWTSLDFEGYFNFVTDKKYEEINYSGLLKENKI